MLTTCRCNVQVYQGISAYASRLDNILEFYGTVNLPQLPGLPKVEPVVLTANLKHYFESIGGATVRITFEDTEVKATGSALPSSLGRRCISHDRLSNLSLGQQILGCAPMQATGLQAYCLPHLKTLRLEKFCLESSRQGQSSILAFHL